MKVLHTLQSVKYLMLFCMLFSCKKNNEQMQTGYDIPFIDAGATAIVNFTGRITDNDNMPISGAVVTAGNQSAVTNVNGDFAIIAVKVSAHAALVKVSKAGFFTGYRTLLVQTGPTYFVSVTLLPQKNPSSFNVASGGTVTASNGGSIHFPANSAVVEATGAAYTGQVKVFSFFLNPSDSNFNNYMPGDLRGIDSRNNEQLLRSYGMMVVEMEGSSGEKLQLAPGKTATITMPIGSALQASAPDSIPLWHFDEAIGLWKEEGKAARQGNEYKGTVAHFSFWNCDAPFQVIRFRASFKDEQGNPLAYCKVRFKRLDGETRSGNADSDGFLDAFIPYNEALEMIVYNSCSVILFTNNVGPYVANVNAGTFTVNNTSALNSSTTITGAVVGCNGLPVTVGSIKMMLGSYYIFAPIINGNFTIPVPTCISATTAILVACDSSTGLIAPTKVVTITPSGQVNAGLFTIACGGNSPMSINMTIDGTQYDWTASASDSLYSLRYYDPAIISYSTRIIYQSVPLLTNTPYLSFTFNGPTIIGSSGVGVPGNYLLTSFQFLPNGTSNLATGYTLSPSSMGIAPLVLTTYGAVGTYINGSFNALAERNGVSVPVQCNFKVRRTS